MKKISFLLGILMLVFVFASCKNDTKENTTKGNKENNSEEVVTDKNTDVDNKNTGTGFQKYDIKSGIITQQSEIMGMTQKIVISFDDYGAKETTDIYTDFMGTTDHSKIIVKDGYMYSLIMAEKKATKTKVYGDNTGGNMDFKNMTDEMKEKMNIKVAGKETILGKECEKITMDYAEMSTSGTFWVWKGIALKSDIIAMGMEVSVEPVKIEEDAKIDQSVFDIPADFEVTEM